MQHVIFCVGISGSGKTTFTDSYLKQYPKTLRLNRDSIRDVVIIGASRTPAYYKRKDLFKIEELVTKVEDTIVWDAIDKGYSLIVDNTNLKKESIGHILFELGDFPIDQVRFKLFDCDPSLAKERVKQRDGIEADYIDHQAKQYEHIKQWLLETYPNNII